jgi:hypothetical protein
MSTIDKDWAVKEIDAFLHATDQVAPRQTPGIVRFGSVQRMSQTDAAQCAHVTEEILDRVLPTWRHEPRPPEDRTWRHLREWAARAKAVLLREDELRERLGDGAPEMDAGQLHPWVWENAASYWRTHHYHQAVMQASIRVNAETQAKIGRRDISETDLFMQAFSLNPPKPGEPRLRLMEDDHSRTFKNVHRGAAAFAEGLYTAIRNPGVHTLVDEGSEHQALEQLAAFSILARWVNEAKVEAV